MPNLSIAKMPDISGMEVSGEELIRSFDYSRPINTYPTASEYALALAQINNPINIEIASLSKNGVVIQDPMEVYLSKKEYFSSSALKSATRSPKALFIEYISGEKERLECLKKPKEYFEFGTFIHSCILEPHKFNDVVVEPKYDKTTTEGVNNLIDFWESKIEMRGLRKDGVVIIDNVKEILHSQSINISLKNISGKREYLKLLKQLSGLNSISEEQDIMLQIIKANYNSYANGILPRLMKHSKTEVSMYYTTPDIGLKVRIRPDGILFHENVGFDTIVSVKSTSATNLEKFAYDAGKFTYELSEGMYQEVASAVTGRDFCGTIMIMVQTVPPFDVAALVWSGEDIEIGKYKYHNALQTVHECIEANKYPGFDSFAESGNSGLIDFKLPSWIGKELQPMDINE